MAQHTSTSRILASLDPTTPMDPAHKIHPKPTPFTAAASPLHQLQPKHHLTTTYPTPEPAAATPSTLQNISLRFSRLYSSHRKLAPNHTKPSNVGSLPQPDTHYQDKILTVSPVSNTSCTTLTKSKSHRQSYDFALSKDVVNENDILVKPSKRHPKKSSLKELDVKKASQLMARSLESGQAVKKLQEGFEGRRSSISSFPRISDGGRRNSFCSSQIELTDFFSCNGVKVVAVDMPPFMQIHAVNCARNSHDSLEKFASKTLAFTLKKNKLKGNQMLASGSKDENGASRNQNLGTGVKLAEEKSKSEPPKGYIHVRARRGQATDSHSLAERARREKISERMKILQDLVPGSNKVIGKALVLDEIINYIQSLQQQVEFLSMKLEAVNSRLNPTLEGTPSKDVCHTNIFHFSHVSTLWMRLQLPMIYKVG